MRQIESAGYMDITYARQRDTKKSLRYRLARRTHEVLSAIAAFAINPPEGILDLGAADGRMLGMVHEKYPDARCVGVEYSQELVDFGKAKFACAELLQGDIRSLPFPDNSFDVAIATAVIEHVCDPSKVLREAKRVLKPAGIIVLTAPDPFWERLATIIGHLNKEQHNDVMNLARLCDLACRTGFIVLKAEKFMLSPVGMPFEFVVEKWIRKFRLDFMMANQLLVARKHVV